MCGSKQAKTTSKVTIPPEVLARYNAVNARAETAANKPFTAFGNTASDYVAQMNAQQNAGIDDINATAGSYIPYMDKATAATTAGMGPAYEGIDRYMSPYIKDVADTTGALMKQQYEQAQSGALGTAAMSGAFGGDRAGIAAANMQQQNQLGYGSTMANIMNQGYTQALGASQADLARQLQGGAQMAGLGAQSQQLGLQGAQAKIAAGTMQQQTEQAGKDAMINRFMQEQGYPFQVAQFLANIAMGTGAAQGSTTTTSTPRNIFGFAQGGGVSGPRTYSQGSIGGSGYVPLGDLPVGQLMVADPPQQQDNGKGIEDVIKLIATMGAARGGAIDQRHGYADGSSVFDPKQESWGEYIARKTNPQYQFATRTLPSAGVGLGAKILSTLPEVASGVAGFFQAPETSTLLHKGAQSLYDWGQKTTREGMTMEGEPPLTGQAALNLARTTPEQDAARAAAMRQNMDLEPSRTDASGIMPSEYGTAMSRGPEAAGWTLGSQPSVTTMTPHGVAGRPDAPVGSMPTGHPNIIVAGRPDVPVGSMPAAPPGMFETPIGSMPAASFVSPVAGRPDVPTGVMPESLAPITSPRPMPRPAGLAGADVAGARLPQPVPATAVIAPPAEPTGVAGPEQTGIYTNVAGAGAGWVDLVRPDGTVEHRAGARNWRNNNPGNIEYGKLAQQYGAIGTDGRFAIFPDEQSGRNAMKGLLFDSGVYQGMTIASALNKYSPPSENDTEGKIRAVVAETGLDPNTPLDQMTPQQRDAFTLAIQHTEGPMKGDFGASSPYTTSQVGGLGGADMAQQRNGLFNNSKPYEDRNMIGKFFHDPTTGKLNPNAVMALLSGIGHAAEAQTISPIGALLSGIGAGSDTYKGLLKQQADIAQTQAQTRREGVNTVRDALYYDQATNTMKVILQNGQVQELSDWQENPAGPVAGGQAVAEQIRAISPESAKNIVFGGLASGETGMPVPIAKPEGGNPAIWGPNFDSALAQDKYDAVHSGNVNVRATSDSQFNQAQADEAVAAAGRTTAHELLGVVADSIQSGQPGYKGEWFARNIAAPLQRAASVLGVELPEDLTSTAARNVVMQKLGLISAADLANAGGAEAVSALQMFADIQPGMDMPPEAMASITAQKLVAQQKALETAEWVRKYRSMSTNGVILSGEREYLDAVNPRYTAETKQIEQLLVDKNPEVQNLVKAMISGAIPVSEAEKALAALTGNPALTRYLMPGAQ